MDDLHYFITFTHSPFLLFNLFQLSSTLFNPSSLIGIVKFHIFAILFKN